MFKARDPRETREADFAVTVDDLRTARTELTKWNEWMRLRYGHPNLPGRCGTPPQREPKSDPT